MTFNENNRNPFEEREAKREASVQEVKRALESFAADESIIKNILESLRKFSDNDLDRFVSGGTFLLEARLREILESIQMESGLESLDKILSKYANQQNRTDKNDDEEEEENNKEENL